MAKVRKRKSLQQTVEETKRPFVPGITRSAIDPMLGGLAGLNAGMQPANMSQQMDVTEMRNQGAPAAAPVPVPRPAKKVKVKKKKMRAITQKEAEEFAETNPMSPQTWANIGNNPSDYPDYLARFKESQKMRKK